MSFIIEAKGTYKYSRWFHSANFDTTQTFRSKKSAEAAVARNIKHFSKERGRGYIEGILYRVREIKKKARD